jgi:iron complex outermembrane receptor protein
MMRTTLLKAITAPVFRYLLFFGTFVGAGLALAAAAHATDANASDTGTPAASGALEEIVVTATRREESISKVPISITAINEDTIDKKGIKDFQDIVRFTPGVSIDTSGTNAISIRGISSSAGAGTTGIYIDDTPIQMRALGFNPDDTLPKTFDLDRVEILRGPQGTLFGSGSEGGTVRYIMAQPSVSTESDYARTEVSYTEKGQPSYEVGVAHGGPIIDDVLGFRASIWYRYDGGWINRVDDNTGAVTEKNANYANTVAARFALLYQPVEGLKITPSVTFQDARKNDESTFWPAYSNVSDGVFNNATPERIPVPDLYYLPAVKIVWDLGKTQLISNSSYYHRDELTGYQGTAYDLAYFQSQSWLIGSCGSASTTPVPPCSWYPLINASGIHLPAGFQNEVTPNQMTNKQATWTQEIRWQSNDDSSAWKWTVGTFWSLSKETSIEELKDTQIIPFWNALFGFPPQEWFTLTANPGNYYYCNGAGTPGQPFPNCDIYYNQNVVQDRQIAGFGEATYSITDRLKLTAGGRLAKVSVGLEHFADGLENYGPNYASASEGETSFTPKVGLAFQADPQNLYYTTYAKGFRPGGANATLPPYCNGDGGLEQTGFPNGAPLTYKSDSTQSYEIGSKNNLGERFRIATSVYYIKWNDIQQNVYVPYNCGLQFTDNLGTAVAKGFDVQSDLVLGAGFTVEAAFGYTSARFSASTPTPNPKPPGWMPLVQKGDAISGEAAIDGGPGTNPPWTVALGAQYDFKLAQRSAFIRMDWEYTARNPWLAATQDPGTAQFDANTYTLSATHFASLRSGITLGDFQVALFCDNLFDSHTTINYELSQTDANNPSFNVLQPTSLQQNDYTWRPRTIGITASFRH